MPSRFKIVSEIAQFRKNKGLTQRQLADLLEVSEDTIANWESGRSELYWLDRCVKLCVIFGCSPDKLISYQEDDSSEKIDDTALDNIRERLRTHRRARTTSPCEKLEG